MTDEQWLSAIEDQARAILMHRTTDTREMREILGKTIPWLIAQVRGLEADKTHPTHVPIAQFGEVVTRVQQLEQENKDLRFQLASNESFMQAKREQEAATRSPVAALRDDWLFVAPGRTDEREAFGGALRAAIKAQAGRWREVGDGWPYGTDFATGYRTALRHCADGLEGK